MRRCEKVSCYFQRGTISASVHRMIPRPLKGGINLSATGYITVNAYASDARIPLQNVAVAILDPDGRTIALRLTDRSGQIPPIPVPVPDLSTSQRPDTGIIPYTTVDIYARIQGYEQIEAEQVQIFADTVTSQDLQLIPLSELPGSWNKTEIFRTPPQNL